MRNLKTNLGILLLVLLVDHANAESLRPWNVLALLPLSGPESGQGDLAKKGIELAMAEEGVPNSIEVIFEDTASDVTRTLSAYRSASSRYSLDAVLTIGSPGAMALSPIVNRQKVVLLALAAAPAYSSPDDYTFRIIGSAKSEANYLTDLIAERFQDKGVAVLYQENDYGAGTAKAFLATAANRLSIVAEESFVPGVTDFRTQLLKLRSHSPEILYLSSWASDAGKIVKQARQLNLNWQFVCSQACVNPDLLASAGDATEGMLISAPSEAIKAKVAERFKERLGEEMTYVPVRFYRAIKSLAKARKRCERVSEPRECLARDEGDAEDVGEVFKFDQNGDLTEEYVLKTVAEGKFVPFSSIQ